MPRFENTDGVRAGQRRFIRGVIWASPGQLDAGFASLATFIAGLVAVRILEVEGLAAYALLSSTFLIASQLPAELVFNPSQVLAIDLPVASRLGMLRHSIPRGLIAGVVSALIVPLGVGPILGSVSVRDLIPLSVSATALSIFSPLQDHMRAMLHLSGRSWIAAATSGIHLVGTGVTLVLLYQDFPLLAPFGALTVGNVVSAGISMFWVLHLQAPKVAKPTFGELRVLGGWLLATGFARTALGYGTRSIIGLMAGIPSLGFLEGSRIVAQPIFVITQGLIAQVGPKSTEAGAKRDSDAASRWRIRFGLLLSLVAVPYALVTAASWPANPFSELAPRAYAIPGLTATMLVAVWLTALLRPLKAEMLGARLQRPLAYLTIWLGLVEIALAFTAFKIGAFAAPIGMTISAIFMAILLRRYLLSLYRPSPA